MIYRSIEKNLLSKEEKIEEEMFLGLRLIEGVNLKMISQKYKLDIEQLYQKPLEKMIAAGHLERIGNQIRLTHQGLLMANEVFEQFFIIDLKESEEVNYGRGIII